MPLFNIFSKKKVEKPEPKKTEKKEKREIEKVIVKKPKKTAKKKTSVIAYKILVSPHISEKATELALENQYVFNVFPRANKTEIKKAIEQVYGIKVLNVRIINIPGKPRKFKGKKGRKKGYKKAIIKIQKGQVIDVMPK